MILLWIVIIMVIYDCLFLNMCVILDCFLDLHSVFLIINDFGGVSLCMSWLAMNYKAGYLYDQAYYSTYLFLHFYVKLANSSLFRKILTMQTQPLE